MDVRKILGENIKKYRKKSGLTQEQLAEKLEISSKHLSNIEIGDKFVSAELLNRLTEILNILPYSLFYCNKPTQKIDDNFTAEIEKIIDEQLKKTAQVIKEKIREK